LTAWTILNSRGSIAEDTIDENRSEEKKQL